MRQRRRVDANGSMWRLRSLTAMGFTAAQMSRALGWHPETVRKLINGDARTISTGQRDQVIGLWEQLWSLVPPARTRLEKQAATSARVKAAVHQWPCPLGLDEEDLDKPGYAPTEPWRFARGIGVAADSYFFARKFGGPGMTYPKDDNGRYFIPSKDDEPRVEVDCHGCGDGWNVPERVWDWFSFCHARRHRKELGGVADVEVTRFPTALDQEIHRLSQEYPEVTDGEREQQAIEAEMREKGPAYQGPGYTEPPADWEGWHQDHDPNWTFEQWAEERGYSPEEIAAVNQHERELEAG